MTTFRLDSPLSRSPHLVVIPLMSIPILLAWCHSNYCHSLHFFSTYVKSIVVSLRLKLSLTLLWLNRFAKWLRFYLPTFTSVCRPLIHLRSSLIYSKQSFKVLRQTFLTPLGFNRLRGENRLDTTWLGSLPLDLNRLFVPRITSPQNKLS